MVADTTLTTPPRVVDPEKSERDHLRLRERSAAYAFTDAAFPYHRGMMLRDYFAARALYADAAASNRPPAVPSPLAHWRQ